MAQQFFQDPGAILDYNGDWTAWLNGDTLASSTWTSHPDITISNTSFTGVITTAYFAGGTPGKTYKVRNKITTVNGRTETETVDLIIRTH